MPLKAQITEDMKTAMRSQDRARLAVIRLILAAIKQKEVDERIELTDTHITQILEKMLKQRRESIEHYEKAQREDLVNQEKFEIQVIQNYLPEALSETELDKLIHEAVLQVQPKTPQDMGKLMTILKPQVAGRAEMSIVSQKIKKILAES